MSANEDRLLVMVVDLHSSISRHFCLVVVDPWEGLEIIVPHTFTGGIHQVHVCMPESAQQPVVG